MLSKQTTDYFYSQMEKADQVFALRDETDAKELSRDILTAISGARAMEYNRVWVLTNNRENVIQMVKKRLDWEAIKKLGLELGIFPWNKQDEISLNLRACRDYSQQQISTLIVRADSYGANLLIV